MEKKTNPVIYSDFPDPDIIRVDDTYYMASTTMHYMPGCDILRSYDLVNWEFVCHAYDTLENTPGHNLEGDSQVYGQGMWAPSLRYHNGTYYVNFTANDTHKTYLLAAKNPAGPWEKRTIEGFYYDSSLFFDDDGHVYIAHGHKQLYLTELDTKLRGALEGGLHRLIASDDEGAPLGFEGSHLYKREGKYYLFSCHIPVHETRKVEECFLADSLWGEFKRKRIIDDDMAYYNLGVAQGGMVDTPDGDWYLFMFHDKGALGRCPMIMPACFDEAGFPGIAPDGKVPEQVAACSTNPGYVYAPLNGDDDFEYLPDAEGKIHLKPFWQFNHNPHNGLWSVTDRPGAYRIYSDKISDSLVRAHNTLTQRAFGPESAAWVTVDGSGLEDGDYAGISAFIGCYGAVAITRKENDFYLVMLGKPAVSETVEGDPDYLEPAVEYERIALKSSKITLKVHTDFTNKRDVAQCYYKKDGEWIQIGIAQKQYFKLDHFTGCRFGLFMFSTRQTGGYADFMKFRYRKQS